MTDPLKQIFFDLHLRCNVDAMMLLPLGIVFAVLLGYMCYTDIFRDKYVSDVSSLGLIFTAIATMPFVYSDPKRMLIWALAAALFFFVLFFVGAIADGDLKIYVAYAIILGPAALPAAFFSWILIIIYSIPFMRKARKEGVSKKGERLGVAPGVPGIALALPLTLALLLGTPLPWPALLLAGIVAVALVFWLVSRIATSKDKV